MDHGVLKADANGYPSRPGIKRRSGTNLKDSLRLKRQRTDQFAGMVGGVFLMFCFSAGCAAHHQSRRATLRESSLTSPPIAGTLKSLRSSGAVRQAMRFSLEDSSEQAVGEAERRLAQARANWEDAKKASAFEIDHRAASQARAALSVRKEFERLEQLVRSGAAATQEVDRARSTNDQNRQRVAQLDADLKTAQLGARADQIAAAEANVRALEAVLAKAAWDFSQKRRAAPQAGLVFDTLYRAGEWVAAGRPVVALLPPQNIKVRAFVPETEIGAIHPGDPVRVTVDGVPEPFTGKISFISPKAEYTPPVIYSQESRGKLVFLIEVVFDPENGGQLHLASRWMFRWETKRLDEAECARLSMNRYSGAGDPARSAPAFPKRRDKRPIRAIRECCGRGRRAPSHQRFADFNAS